MGGTYPVTKEVRLFIAATNIARKFEINADGNISRGKAEK